ncbi:MAG TPA: hypothetical protein VKB79_03175 [Bryobacteraceae bacterium]|nr:hypothetical protein [Bryobacteraceae bacterium]
MRFLKSTVLLLAASLGMNAANFSGKWALSTGGRGGPTIFILNQVGDDVSGHIVGQRVDPGSGAPQNQEVLDGKVNGDVITFYIWTGSDVPAKRMYKGTMSGDEIKFEITGGPAARGGGGAGRGQATPAAPPVAKRIK